MAKRKQHPLITAMNKFDNLLAGLDANMAEAFVAYVSNKLAIRRPKSVQPATTSTRKKKETPPPLLTEVTKPVLCGLCGNEADYQDHYQPSPSYHEFEGKKSKSAA